MSSKEVNHFRRKNYKAYLGQGLLNITSRNINRLLCQQLLLNELQRDHKVIVVIKAFATTKFRMENSSFCMTL